MRLPILLVLLMAFLAIPASAQWTTSTSKDEMTGELSSYAHSPATTATKRLDFPYRGTRAWLGVGCDGESEWAYVGFSEAPNLLDTSTKDGYDTFRTRVKWDQAVETMEFRQTWGAEFIHFQADETAIAKMATASTVLLELKWYGAGTIYFRFSLRGSSSALAKARAACGR